MSKSPYPWALQNVERFWVNRHYVLPKSSKGFGQIVTTFFYNVKEYLAKA